MHTHPTLAGAATLVVLRLIVAAGGAHALDNDSGFRTLRGEYPAFEAPSYAPPSSVCDAMVAPCSATGDGHADDTHALQSCIERCDRDKDGRFAVLLRRGHSFLSGALNMSSGLRLVVDGTLLGSTDPAAYPVLPPLPGYGPGQRDNAVHGYGRHQALLSGWNMHDVVVAGSGVIDGQGLVNDPVTGSSWVSRFECNRHCVASKSCSATKLAACLQFGRPRIWEPMFSHGLILANVSIRNQAFWAVHPYACDDVYIGHVNVSAPRDEGIPNDDGIDPDSTSNVLVDSCWVSVGDNSVAIKSGMDLAGRRFARASFNQVYRNSVFTCETFAIGSEMSGGVFNITVDACVFGTDGSDFAGIHFKAPRGRGGSIHDVHIINSEFHLETSVKQSMPISASMFYGKSAPPTNATATPQVHDCLFANLSFMLAPAVDKKASSAASVSFQFLGLPESKMRDFHFQNITVRSGKAHGWQCMNTSGFTFEGVSPAPTVSSGCLRS